MMASAFPEFSEMTAAPKRRPTKKETILSLVEMLLQNEEEADPDSPRQPTFENDKDVPTVDENLQVVGSELFNRFQKRVIALDKELRNFANAARQLGSSAAILSSAFHLRERLAHILHLYRENAADLFPRKVTRLAPQPTDTKRKRRRRQSKTPAHVARPVVDENLDLEHFPEQFDLLAKDVTTFVSCLNEFPEFTDDAVNASILSFEGDLKYWASCLREYQGQFRYPSVQRYLHDLTAEMGEHLDSITSTVSMFVEVGVPTIRFAQKHGATNLLNLSTVATFFSAVTATTLQFSYADTHEAIADAVNCFWFASLVFSIAAAVNSLLGLTWKQAMYRSPQHRIPWWVLIWIKRSPLVFLVASVACFSIGLCCFAYSSGQSSVTSTLTTVLTAFTSFGLVAVSTWFASERWTFLRHRGKLWLSDVLIDYEHRLLDLPGVRSMRKNFRRLRYKLRSVRQQAVRMSSRTLSSLSTTSSEVEKNRDDDLEANTLPVTAAHERDGSGLSAFSPRSRISDTTAPVSPSSPEPASPVTPAASPIPGSESGSAPTSPGGAGPSLGKQLWRNAIKTVTMRSAVSSNLAAMSAPRAPHRQRTTSSTLASNFGDRKKTLMDEPVKTLLRSRVAGLVPKLRCLEPMQDLPAHQALVRHLQFSPDGKFLATSSWDRTSLIFRVGDPFVSHRILAHTKGFVGQVAWSPSGNLLLTKLVRGIKVWNEDGVCQKTIDRPAYVESLTWSPGSEFFLSVEGSNVAKLDLNGTLKETYHFGKVKLHDVAVTPDSVRLLGVGPLLESPTGLQPRKSRGEKRLIVYNTETHQVESQTPVLNDVRDVTLSQNTRNGLIALVSYENKAPPQLWKMELVKDRDNNAITTARMTLRHTYMPKVPVDFAGPSYFGGKNDELVLCAGKAGDIHIWDTESAALLHHVRAQVVGGDLTCIAWNRAAEDPFMFATGSHDGGIRIWTRPPELAEMPDEPATMFRTSSPFDMEDIERTDSPITQQDLDDNIDGSQAESGPSTRERVVAFASENNLQA